MWLVFWFLSIFGVFGEYSQCNSRIYEGAFKNLVCVCNSTHCDEIEPIGNIPEGFAAIYRSTLDGDRLRRIKNVKMGKTDDLVNVTITLDASERFQQVFGFGGAFTDSAGIQLAAVSPALQDQVLQAYFGENGLEYNVGRVPIASCDFSTHEYSYADSPNDFELKNFSLTIEDFQFKIPFIKKAMKISKNKLKLFASPWSAPGWMKVTGRMKGGGAMKEDTRIYQTYADYFVKFFSTYLLDHQIPFWGVTIQNEPSTGADMSWRWQTMNYTAETMKNFLNSYLGPTLKKSPYTKNLKVMILDDGRGLLPGWADTMFNDSETSQFAHGIAVHWYGNLYSPAVLLDVTQRHHPDKFILSTEACAGYFGHHGPILGDWFRAESYADDIITNLNHHVTGWTDWNLCLDETGGPNWALNVVDSPVIVNRTAGEFYKQPMFYAMGHFSKFLPRGSTRILTKVEGNLEISATSVVIDGGRRSTVILSKSENFLKTRIVDSSTGFSVVLEIAPRSIHTIIWDKRK